MASYDVAINFCRALNLGCRRRSNNNNNNNSGSRRTP
jgi:hypothetical protein